MLIKFWNAFTKITAWPIQWLCFRTKVYCEDASVQDRRIQGQAIIISNHTSVFDYAVYLFVFFSRTLRFQMAELLFKKPVLGTLLRMLGGIYVNRNVYDFSFLTESEHILSSGGVVGVFPEGRLPREGEARPLEFKTSAAYLALSSGAPVIPVYTNGCYFRGKRARVIIGAPLYARELTDPALSDRENIRRVAELMRQRIIELENILHERQSQKEK